MANKPCNSTSLATDDSPLTCYEFTSTECIIHPNALIELSLPENTDLKTIITAILNSIINLNNLIGEDTEDNGIEVQKDGVIVLNEAQKLNFLGNIQAAIDAGDPEKVNVMVDMPSYSITFDGTNINLLEDGTLISTQDLSSLNGLVTDGNKGEITVNGLTWTINNGVITESKLSTSVNNSLSLANSALQSGDLSNYALLSGGPTTQTFGQNTNAFTNVTISGALLLNGATSSMFITPHDTEPTATEGHYYNDLSEHRPKYHDGTSFKKILLEGDVTGSVPDDTGASNGDVLTTDGSGTYTWETPSGGGSSLPVDDTTALVQDPSDNTKQVRIDAENVGTGSTAVLSVSGNNQFQDTVGVKGQSFTNNSFFGLYKNDGTTIIGGFSGFGDTDSIEFGNSISNESLLLKSDGTLNYSGFTGGGNLALRVDNNGDFYTEAIPSGGGSGDVTKVGTPVNNQLAVWTGDGTVEGDASVTFDGATFNIDGDITLTGTVDGRDVASDGAKTDLAIVSDITGLTGGIEINNIVGITQAGYDAIGVPDPNTEYKVVDAPSYKYITLYLSGESDDLEVATDKARSYCPYTGDITSVIGVIGTAPTGSSAIFDVNLNGSTIMTTDKVEIEAGETSSETATTQPAITTASVSKGDIFTADIDQIGSTIAGSQFAQIIIEINENV